jgi:hypothetical protein
LINFDKVKGAVLNLILLKVGEFIGIIESVTDFIGVTSEQREHLNEQAEKSS